MCGCRSLVVLGALLLTGQFDVASVKPSVAVPMVGAEQRSGGPGVTCRRRWKTYRTRFEMSCLTLPELIAYAYRVDVDRVSGPAWLNGYGAPRFDIVATFPERQRNWVPEMLQALLAERFKLAVHRERRVHEVLALVIAKGGLKAKASPRGEHREVDSSSGTDVRNFGGELAELDERTLRSPAMGTVHLRDIPGGLHIEAPDTTFEGLAGLLTTLTVSDVPTVDMTERDGRYQIALDVSWQEVLASRSAADPLAGPRDDPAHDSEVAFAQVEQFRRSLHQLGLELERRKGVVDTIVVDRVERTPVAN
jgi:uncharacterized protein (TIGR03435 family)